MLHALALVRTTFLSFWESATSSYWLPPALMAVGGTALAVGMVAIDASGPTAMRAAMPWVYTGSADGAREILGTVASSMMTVLSVTFSVTIVALTVASQQFGPHVLHNFIRRPGPQVVLGSFIATFLYSLIVLRTVRVSDAEVFVPHLSVTVAVLLAGFSIAAFIYFIHHVSASIQASNIIEQIAGSLDATIERLFPEDLGSGRPDGDRSPARPAAPAVSPGPGSGAGVVEARTSGYVQAVDDERLLRTAKACDALITLLRRPGDFVVKGAPIAEFAPAGRLNGAAARGVRTAIMIGPRRTAGQDAAFGLTQLLEIALHALSPALNEPFLAISCINRLVQALDRLAGRRIPSACRVDGAGTPRVWVEPFTFVEAADLVFDALLEPASSDVSAASHLLESLGGLAGGVRRAADREALARHALALQLRAREKAAGEHLKRRIDAAYDRARPALLAR